MKYVTPSIVRYLFFITALELMIFGAGSFMRVNQYPELQRIYNIYAVLMLVDAAVMLGFSFYIHKQIKAVYWLAAVVLSLNIVLTIFDQLGLIDILFSLLNAAILAMLFFLRKELLPQ